MSLEKQIEEKIRSALSPSYFEIENESHMHSGNRTNSHFRLVVVSEAFNDLRLIGRHRKINALLADELANEIHALALHTFSPKQWEERGGQANSSPQCSSKTK